VNQYVMDIQLEEHKDDENRSSDEESDSSFRRRKEQEAKVERVRLFSEEEVIDMEEAGDRELKSD
jgi:hypothetical protein